jgi:Protein of unknown function (DUF2914)
VGSTGTRVRYSYSGSGWSMRTIDPVSSEPNRGARRLRPLALSIGAAIVCVAIGLVVLFLLLRQPDRAAGVASRGGAPAVQLPAIVPETSAPPRERLAPEPVMPPATILPSEPETPVEISRPLSQPSGEAGYLAPPPSPATASKPAETKPPETKSAALVRRPPRSRATTGQVSEIVLAFAAARPAEGDPITSPIVLGAGQEKRVMLYTELRDLAGQTVSHRWQHEGRTVAVIPFEVKGDRWRVHSTKRLSAELKGSWQVIVVDGHGATLASRSFVVR